LSSFKKRLPDNNEKKNHNLPVTSRISHIQSKIRRHIPTSRTNPPRCMELSLEPACAIEKLRAGAKIRKYNSFLLLYRAF